jgi:C-terminal processing protease CtpA/Prc
VSLPILWDRSGKTPVLKVVEVMPGSAMERAGCKAEDEILRAGPLEGKALTRRSLLALMAKGEPHGWTVRRGNALVQLELNPPK